MTIGWLIYAVAVAALAGVAALGAETVARASARPTRWIWGVALALSVGFPAEALRTTGSRSATATVESAAAAVTLGTVEAAETTVDPAMPTRWDRARARAGRILRRPLPRAFRWGGGLATLGVVLALVLGALQDARRARRWPVRVIHGVRVHVSDRSGPAVSGVLRGRIVIPRHALALPEDDLRAIVTHEDEHLGAGDVRVLAAALLLVAMLAWNPLVWWQLERFRLALETDCDRRTIRRLRSMSAIRYGRLLLSLARDGGPTLLASAALGRPTRSLESRIRYLTRGVRGRVAVGGAIVAILAGAVACEVPQPAAPLPLDEAGKPMEANPWLPGPWQLEMPENLAALAGTAWSGEGRGEIAVRAHIGPRGRATRTRVDAFSETVTAGMAQAASDIVTQLRVTNGEARPPASGWIAVWLLFDQGAVTATLVSSDLYDREGITGGSAGTERLLHLMDTYRRLSGGLGRGLLNPGLTVGIRSLGGGFLRLKGGKGESVAVSAERVTLEGRKP